MTNEAKVSVTARGAGAYSVEVRAAGVTTTHSVEVPAGLADQLGWGQASEEELVRLSFVFLLDREPPSSILRQFSLEVIGRYFPEYPTEIRRSAER